MLRVILDTNVFVSAIMSKENINRRILRLAFEGKIQPIFGSALFLEYEDLIHRDFLFQKSPIDRKDRINLLNALISISEWQEIYFRWRPNLRDEADNHLIELAIAGNAQFIITRNIKDLTSGELRFNEITIISPETFLKEYNNG